MSVCVYISVLYIERAREMMAVNLVVVFSIYFLQYDPSIHARVGDCRYCRNSQEKQATRSYQGSNIKNVI